jgi:hypothetical protein
VLVLVRNPSGLIDILDESITGFFGFDSFSASTVLVLLASAMMEERG